MRIDIADSVIGFVPCRAGSERVPGKNTRSFAGVNGGLFEIKLNQLLNCRAITEIMVSTDDREIVRMASARRETARKPISVLERPPELASSEASTDALIEHVAQITSERKDEELVLWTHVTAPFFDADWYDRALAAYSEAISRGHDSLCAVTRLQTFLWGSEGPINYDRSAARWPRTQTLQPVWAVNSAAFVAPLRIYRERGDRIGSRPFLFETPGFAGFDIDWPDEFGLAEAIWIAHEKLRRRQETVNHTPAF